MAHGWPAGNARFNWRFPLFIAALAIGTSLSLRQLSFERALLVGFDIAAAIFLVSCAWLFAHETEDMRDSATANDAGRVARLTTGLLLVAVMFAAMASLIVDRGALTGPDKALIVITLALVWLFANTMYTLHYAHLYYSADAQGRDRAGLKFPETREPSMADFAYFAFTIGVAVQTADVAISSARIRKVVTVHAILGFFFNIGVLALTINVLAGG